MTSLSNIMSLYYVNIIMLHYDVIPDVIKCCDQLRQYKKYIQGIELKLEVSISPPMRDVSPPITGLSSPIIGVSTPVRCVSTPIRVVSPDEYTHSNFSIFMKKWITCLPFEM